MNKIVNNLIGWGEESICHISVDPIKEEARIGIKHIFRPGSNNCEFGFDPEKCIDEGILVITDVRKIFFDSTGAIPNDLEKLEVIALDEGFYEFIFKACDHDKITYQPISASMTIVGKEAYLLDAKNPDLKIIE